MYLQFDKERKLVVTAQYLAIRLRAWKRLT